MRVALDTNRYVDFCRGEPAVVDIARTADQLILPFVVLAELRAGFACGTRANHNDRILTRFLNSPRVRVIYADDQTTHHYATLFKQLRMQGTPVPTNDLWTASLVVQHNLLLCSRDGHFDHFQQLARV